MFTNGKIIRKISENGLNNVTQSLKMSTNPCIIDGKLP